MHFFFSILVGVNGHLHSAASFPAGNEPPVPWTLGWIPDPVWTPWTRDETRPPFRNYGTVTGTLNPHFIISFVLIFLFIVLSLKRGNGEDCIMRS